MLMGGSVVRNGGSSLKMSSCKAAYRKFWILGLILELELNSVCLVLYVP